MDDDVERETPAPDPGEYPLAPDEIEDEAEARWYALRRLAAARARLMAELNPTQPEKQLSLRYLMFLTAVASVLFATARLVSPDIFAGICGIVALVSVGVLQLFRQPSAKVVAAWWMLMLVYILTSIFASFSRH
jgi:hypothetical protein